MLLRDVLGDESSFELYGDVQQQSCAPRGMLAWDELQEALNLDLLSHNVNYRNPLPITDYCNRTLGTKMIAIGLSGEPVREVDLYEGMSWFFNKALEKPSDRCAIICTDIQMVRKWLEHYQTFCIREGLRAH